MLPPPPSICHKKRRGKKNFETQKYVVERAFHFLVFCSPGEKKEKREESGVRVLKNPKKVNVSSSLCFPMFPWKIKLHDALFYCSRVRQSEGSFAIYFPHITGGLLHGMRNRCVGIWESVKHVPKMSDLYSYDTAATSNKNPTPSNQMTRERQRRQNISPLFLRNRARLEFMVTLVRRETKCRWLAREKKTLLRRRLLCYGEC